MSLVPSLIDLKLEEVTVVDCGAGIGLFSLFIEHLLRIGMLGWKKPFYVMMEPSRYNFDLLKRNVVENLDIERVELHNCLVGMKEGSYTFYEHKGKPYSSSILDRKDVKVKKEVFQVPFLDVSEILRRDDAFLKLDIEGAEFMFLESYRKDLDSLKGVIVEWHSEMGDVERGIQILEDAGLKMVKRSWDRDTRFIDLYLRS